MNSIRKMVKNTGIGLFAAICIVSFSAPVSYGTAAKNVAVTIPSFSVTLNGTAIDNSHREYPLLVYQGITYFPLTYYDTRFLGVESEWNQAARKLAVNKSDISGGYQAVQRKQANGKNYQATVCTFPVQINGGEIDNSKEPYPLLTFRNVTYFPMTWDYGVGRFGWSYQFDEKTGLTIASANLKPMELGLGVVSRDTDSSYKGDYGYRVRLLGDYYYYEGQKGGIYQATITNPKQGKKVFQLPNWDAAENFVWESIDELNGKMVLRFHQGGGVMGHDETWLFETDGTSQRIEEDPYTHVVQGDGFTISSYTGMYSSWGNLLKTVDGQEAVAIGRPDVRYGGTLVLRGNKIYVMGEEREEAINANRHGLYEVDLTTNQTRLINDPAIRLDALSMGRLTEYSDQVLYFVGGVMPNGLWEERNLYKLDLSKEQLSAADIELVTELNFADPQYAFCGENLYYNAGTFENQTLYRLGQKEAINPNGNLTYLFSDQGYVIAGFSETAKSDTRLMVFDQSGNVVFRSADAAQRPQIDQGRLFYITKDGRSYITELD